MRGSGRRAGKKSRLLALLMCAAVCAALIAACGGGGSTGKSPTGQGGSQGTTPSGGSNEFKISPVKSAVALLPANVKKSGVLISAMTMTSPPSTYEAAGSNQLIGFDPNIAQMLADALGLKLEMRNVGFDEIIPGMQAGKYQIAIAELAPTPAREKVLNFVDYANEGDALAVQKGNPMHISMNNLCGLTIGALAGGYQITQVLPAYQKQCLKNGKKAIQFKLYPNETVPILALASNRIDGVYEDQPVLDYAAKHNPQIEVQTNRNFGPVAVGIAKQTGLLPAVHAAMQAVIKTPQYHQMLASLGLTAIAITDAKVNDNG